MKSPSPLFPALLLIVATGCYHRGVNAPQNLELLTQAEMLDNHFTNMYDAVESLRGKWLNVRGTDSFIKPSEVLVYFDQTRLGGVDQLRNVTVNSVMWARHYNGIDATMRWGVGHSAGVVFLSSYQ